MHKRRAALPFLLVTGFLDIFGLGIVVPIAPKLITQLGADSGGVLIFGLLVASYALMQFFAAPMLGRLSDRVGRRPVLLVSLTFLGLDYSLQAIAGSVWVILVGRLLAGAFAGTYTVVGAYIADVTEPRDRARAYGYLSATFSLGFVAGPALGGLLGEVNLRLPFAVAAGLVHINVLYGLFWLPESLPVSLRRPMPRRRMRLRVVNPVTAIVHLARRPGVGQLVWMRLCADVARQINQVVWALFAMTRFDWSLVKIGVATSAAGLVGAAAQLLAGGCVRRLGEKNTVTLGCLAWAAALVGTATTTTAWLLGPLLALGALGSLAGTASQSWLSAASAPGDQGELHGALTSVAAFAEVTVPIPAAALFAWSVGAGRPGLVFVIAAGFLIAGAIFAARCTASRVSWSKEGDARPASAASAAGSSG